MTCLRLAAPLLLIVSVQGQEALPPAATLDGGSAQVQFSGFGSAIASDEGWIAIGAPQSTNGAIGEAHIFRRVGASVYEPFEVLTGGLQSEEFGAALDVDVDGANVLVAVGLPGWNDQASGGGTLVDQGQVQVFSLTPDGFTFVDDIVPAVPESNTRFGTAVGISASRLAIGSPAPTQSRVDIWDLSTPTPTATCFLLGIGSTPGDGFGSSIAIDGSLLAVGAPDSPDAGLKTGVVYLFEDSSASNCFVRFGQEALLPLLSGRILAPVPAAGDRFGESVGLDGLTLAVGTPGSGTGVVHVYRIDPTSGVFYEQELQIPGLLPNAEFGSSVRVAADRILVGAPNEGTSGRAYTFVQDPILGWIPEFSLDPNLTSQAEFGIAVAIDGDQLLVGAPQADGTGTPPLGNAGLVYVHDASAGTCVTDVLGSPTQSAADRFGSSLAYIEDALFVGSPQDDTNGTDSGSVAVFERAADAWEFVQDLDLTTAPALSRAGAAIDATDDRVLVGSPGSTKFGPVPGRVHEFPRDPSTGALSSPVVRESASPQAGDRFGAAVQVDGGWTIVGSPGRDGREGSVEARPTLPQGSKAQRLVSPDLTDGQTEFGASVALADDFLAVGAPFDSSGGTETGSITTFRRRDFALLEGALTVAADPIVSQVAAPGIDLTFGGDGIALIHDVDGNGIRDLAVGCIFGDALGNETGGLDILFLGSNAEVIGAVDLLDDPALWPELKSSVRLGVAVASGQFDDDPELELAVGASQLDPGGTSGPVGGIYIVDIDTAGTPSNVRLISGGALPLVPLTGTGGMGHAVVNLGDLDGNSVDDLAVGCWLEATGSGNQGGVRTLLMGPTGSPLTATRFDAVTLGLSYPTGGRMGMSIEFLPDADGQGGVLAVGDPFYQIDGVYDSAVYFVRIDQTGASTLIERINASQYPEVDDGGTSFSWGLTLVPDVNGDGNDDLLILDYQAPVSGTAQGSNGAFHLFLIKADGSPTLADSFDVRESALSALGTFNRLGRAAEWLGDVDADGIEELYVSARPPGPGGSGFVILEVGEGWHLEAPKLVADDPIGFERLGSSLATDGEVLLSGAPGILGDPGRVFVYEALGSEPQIAQVLQSADPLTTQFGRSLSLADDRVAVGSPSGFGPTGGAPSVSVFERFGPGETYFETRRLQGDGLVQVGDRFGESLVLLNDEVLIGAPSSDLGGVDSGTALAYSLQGGCPTLLASSDFISLTTGGSQQVVLEPGSGFGAAPYLTVISGSPNAIPLAPGVILPITPDSLTTLSLSLANQGPFVNTFGVLDPVEGAQSEIVFEPGLPTSLAGSKIYVAYLVLSLPFLDPVFASESESLIFVAN